MAGYAACGFDFNRMQGVTNVDGPTSEDITTERGFRNAVDVLLRIRVGGLATFAPMCGSFNWLCAAQAKRGADNGWLGGGSAATCGAAHPFVLRGNAAAKATAFLARVAVLRGVQASVENPPRSYMWNMFHHHAVLLDLPHSCRTLRCGFRTSGSTEDEITKEYRFACTHPWVVSLARRCTCPPSVAHIAMTKIKEGKSWGIPSVMRRSQEYPELLGAAVVAAWAARPALLALGDSVAPDLEDVLSVDSQSEPALLGDSESEQDLFGELDLLGGGGISADVSDGRAADVVDDDSDAALFSE